MRKRFGIGASAALILILALMGRSACAKVVQSVSAGFDNQIRESSWAPVSFLCVNDTGTDVEAELTVRLRSRQFEIPYRCPVHLPSPSRKVVTLGVYLSPVFSRTSQSLEWNLLRDGRVVESGTHQFEALPRTDRLFLAIASQPNAFQLLQGRKTGVEEGKISIVSVTLAGLGGLPDRAFYYEGLNGIFWGDLPPGALRPDQMEALAGYVRAGGNLIASGGPAGEQLKGTWLEDLLPVEIQGQRVLHRLDAAESIFFTPIDLGSGWVATEAKGVPGKHGPVEILLAQDGMPLLARAPYGLGWISWLAIDPNTPPLLAWPAASEFLHYLLFNARFDREHFNAGFDHASPPGRYQRLYAPNRSNKYQSLVHSLFDDPVLRPPSFQFISFFLLIYVLVVGPINYLVLRRKKKLEWTWVTIPVVVLLFLGAEYGLGRYLKGGRAVVNEATLLLGRTGEAVVQQQSLAGFFSPSKRRYHLSYAAGQGRVIPSTSDYSSSVGQGASCRQESQIVLADYPMNMWTMEVFSARGEKALGGPIRCEVEERGSDRVARLLNEASLRLEQPCLYWEGNYYLLPEVANGPEMPALHLGKGSASIPAEFFATADEPEKRRRQALFDLFNEIRLDCEAESPFLLAWVDSGIGGFQPEGIRGVFRQQALLGMRLDPPRPTGQLRLPFSYYRFRVLTEEAKSWRESADFSFGQEPAVIELLPYHNYPRPVGIDRFLIRMNVTNRSGDSVPMAAFDWYRHEWIPIVDSLRDHRYGGAENISLTGLPGVNPLAFLRPSDQAVRLRFGLSAIEPEIPSAPEAVTPWPPGADPRTFGMNLSRDSSVSISQVEISLEGQLE